MINRVLIRTKVVQLLYAFYMKEPRDKAAAEKELQFSMEKSYELYHRLLLLPSALTDVHEERLEQARAKYLPSEKELNPNMRLINNRFVAQLRQNEQLQAFCEEKCLSWHEEPELLRILLDKVISSDIYKEYLANEQDDYNVDREFWRKVFKNILAVDADLSEALELDCLYWNDDISIVSTFVLKTIKQFDPEKGAQQPLLPMYKDGEDAEFAVELFRATVDSADAHRAQIESYVKNWDLDRVAFMDVVIMLVALAEIEHFPSIPINVSLNEYIEIAKVYSTPRSGTFVNGVLDTVISNLKKEKKLIKA